MTLLDLVRLMRRYIVLIVALPVVFGVACFGYFAVSSSDDVAYVAKSRVIVSTHVHDVGGLAAVEARANTDKDANVKVASSIDEKTNSVMIAVTTMSEESSIDLANEIAEAILVEAENFVPYNSEDPFRARIELAEEVEESRSSGHMKYVLASLVAGLFLAICIVIIIDYVKRPIKGEEGLQAATGLPVLGKYEGVAVDSDRILANAFFASKRRVVRNLCLMPISGDNDITLLQDALSMAQNSDGAANAWSTAPQAYESTSIEVCGSPLEDVQALYKAHDSDATLLVVREWIDSYKTLEQVIQALMLAEAKVIGVILVK